MFEIERVRDRERKIGYNLHKGTEILVRDIERFEIEGARGRESHLYTLLNHSPKPTRSSFAALFKNVLHVHVLVPVKNIIVDEIVDQTKVRWKAP